MPEKRGSGQLVVALLVAALVGVPWQGAVRASDGEEPPAESAILAGALRLAAAETAAPQEPEPAPAPAGRARSGTSFAEKLACLYLLVGGSIMLAYGPSEKVNGVLTNDGKSEGIGGAAAVALSFALMHDIWKRRAPAPAGGH
jgi:hypothetical protein